MIAKTFILAKEIRALRAKSLRDTKSLRDNRAASMDRPARGGSDRTAGAMTYFLVTIFVAR
jgi:hypothetical protein